MPTFSLDHPEAQLSSDQVETLANNGFSITEPRPLRALTGPEELRAIGSNFARHFFPPVQQSFVSYRFRRAFLRLHWLFEAEVNRARSYIECDGPTFRVIDLPEAWDYLFRVYLIMARLVDISDPEGQVGEDFLIS